VFHKCRGCCHAAARKMIVSRRSFSFVLQKSCMIAQTPVVAWRAREIHRRPRETCGVEQRLVAKDKKNYIN
jgi:hypothetical protein